jgi:hypothetical protein
MKDVTLTKLGGILTKVEVEAIADALHERPYLFTYLDTAIAEELEDTGIFDVSEFKLSKQGQNLIKKA